MYGPAFKSMYDGSLYGAGLAVFAVWGYVIANAYAGKGRVELNARKLADTLGGDVSDIQKAIEFLCAPDPHSRSTDEQGARLVREAQFMYRVVNWRKYKELMSKEARKEAQAAWAREHRQPSTSVDTTSTDVDRPSTHKEEEKEEDREQERDLSAPDSKNRVGDPVALSRTRARATRGTRLPEDWTPRALTPEQRATIELSDGEIAEQIPRFRDHWAAASGAKAIHADWDATWRNWLRRAPELASGKHKIVPIDPKKPIVQFNEERPAWMPKQA